MQYTNHLNLPQSLCKAVERDNSYERTSDVGVTEIVKPLQQAVLERQHYDDIEVDVADQIFMLMGRAVHTVLEKSDTETTEERVTITTKHGYKLGGKIDRLVLEHGQLQDYKFTSVWSWVFKSYEEWQEQLKIYAMMLIANGYQVKTGEIVMIFRDWSQTMADRNPDYPQNQVELVEVVLPIDFTMLRERIEDQVKLYMDCLAGLTPLPECSAEEMWESPTKYALMKEGRKSAIKVSESHNELMDYAEQKGWYKPDEHDMLPHPYSIEHRPGQRKRCEKYCNAAPWCGQYAEYQIQQQTD